MTNEQLQSNLELITQEQQNIINNLEVAVIGNNPLSDIVLANLAGLGVKAAYVFGEETGDKIFDDNHFLKFSSICDITYFDNNFKKANLEDWRPSLIMDISEIEEEKQEAYKASQSLFCGFISMDFNEEGSVLYPLNSMGKYSDNILPVDTNNECLQSRSILATIGVDEIRKSVMKLNDKDKTIKEPLFMNNNKNKFEGRDILVVGAGGIGNYFALGSRYMKDNFRIVDFDSFETKNMNRQVFCDVGKNKGKVISSYFDNFSNIDKKVDKEFLDNLDKPDMVIGCVDNNFTRNILSDYCKEKFIPYLDGGVGITQGQISFNPEKKQVRDVSKEDSSCLYKPNPSIVIPNCIIGLKLSDIIKDDIKEGYRFFFNSFSKNRYEEY
ncbi:MAG: ThiF family adenylyltransferase [Nanobdellota archaeon]